MNVIPCELREYADGLIATNRADSTSLDYRLMMAGAERIEELESENERLATKCDLLLTRLRAAVEVMDAISTSCGDLRLPIGEEDICRLRCALRSAKAVP